MDNAPKINMNNDAAEISEMVHNLALIMGYRVKYREGWMGFYLLTSETPGALSLFIRKDAKKDGALSIRAEEVTNSGTVYRPGANGLPGDKWDAPRIGVAAQKASESPRDAAQRIAKAISSRLLPDAVAYHAAASSNAARHNAHADKIRANKEHVAKVRGVPLSVRESSPDRETLDLHTACGIYGDSVQVSADTFKLEAYGIPMHRLAAVIAAMKGTP